MTGTTKVSPAEVHILSEYVSKKSAEIGDALTELDNKVSKLKGSWDGEAKEAYEAAQRAWTTQITEMNGLLARVGGKLVEVGNGYSETDRRGANRFVV
jgi:WXG100 family type VII secretion target